MNNLIGILVSLLYITVIMGVSTVCYKKKKFNLEDSRKFVHIGLCNTFLIAMIYFDSWIYATILPVLFTIFNIVNIEKNIVPGIERNEKHRTLGTVWYCIAVAIVTFLFFRNQQYLYVGAIAILTLGYADGVGGIISEYFGKHKFPMGYKTAEGSFTVFLLTFLIAYAILSTLSYVDLVLPYSFFIACFACIIELFSIGGSDNITLPLGVALGTYLLVTEPTFLLFGISFAITGIIVYVALLNGMLTYGAGILAMILGTTLFYLNGPLIAGSVIVFFLTSAILEKYHKKTKQEKVKNMYQVLENAIPFILFGVMYYFTKSEVALVCELVSIAGACSDTWSSGLGYYSKEKVRSVLTFKVMPKGESGGVTLLGTFGSLCGALLIALFSLPIASKNLLLRFVLILVFGMFTSYLDSLFGILLQVKYLDEKKGIIYEKKPKNMKGIKKVSGYGFINNEMVNFLTIMISALIAGVIASIIL